MNKQKIEIKSDLVSETSHNSNSSSAKLDADIITVTMTQNYSMIKPKSAEPIYYSGWKLAIIQFSLNLAMFVVAMDNSIVSAPLETISEHFNKYSLSSWIISAYSLSTAMGCTLWSRVSVKLGKKMSIIVALLGFELGSLITALSTSMYMLIVGRVIQGSFGSGLIAVSFIISSTLVPEEKRAFLLSLLSISFSVGSVTPLLGGLLSQAYSGGWRLCFYINLPIGIFAFFLFNAVYEDPECPTMLSLAQTIAFVHKYEFKKFFKAATNRKTYIKLLIELVVSFDLINFILVSTGFIMFLLAITFAGGDLDKWHWYEPNCILFLILGPILLIAGIFYDCFLFFKVVDYLKGKFSENVDFPERINIGPLMTEKLFVNVKIFSVNMLACFTAIATGCQSVYVIQYFQLLFNYSPLLASINSLPSMLSTSSFVLLSGIIISRTGHIKYVIMVGACLTLLGNGLLTILSDTSNEAEKLIFVFMGGIGFGFSAQSSLLSSQRELDPLDPRYKMDFVSITGCNVFAKQVGMCIGSVVATMIFNTSVINKIRSDFPEYSYLKPDSLIAFRRHNFDGRHSPFSKMLSKSIQNVFYFGMGISVIPIIFMWFISKKKILTKKEISKLKEHQLNDIEQGLPISKYNSKSSLGSNEN
ncbi:hypothetical protein QEN19_001312 [Hanseniaspora menglaensis]